MAFRAFYALPVDSFTTSTGQPTNAVHGFVSMFLSLIEQEEPTHVAVAFDLPGGTFRTQEYAEYKGTRDETPAPFVEQVGLIEEVLKAMNVRALTASGYEADDILATLAASAQAEGMEVLVCSGDRDSFQTVTDRCTVLYPIKGVSTLRRMTPGEVEDRYGVPPQRYPQLAALVGEPSDNLPGVPGVGPKTAAKWINLYDGLDGVIAHADRIKGKAGQSLRDHVGDVVRNRRLNRLVTNLDLDVAPTADLILRAADRAELARVMDALEFRTLYQRAQRILTFSEDAEGPDNNADGTGQESPAARLESLDVAVLGRDITLGSLGQWLGDRLMIDAETGEGTGSLGLEVVGTVHPGQADATAIALSDGRTAVVVDTALAAPEDETALADLLSDIDVPLIVTDAKGAWHALRARGLSRPSGILDPALSGHRCRPGQRRYVVDVPGPRRPSADLDQLCACRQAGLSSSRRRPAAITQQEEM